MPRAGRPHRRGDIGSTLATARPGRKTMLSEFITISDVGPRSLQDVSVAEWLRIAAIVALSSAAVATVKLYTATSARRSDAQRESSLPLPNDPQKGLAQALTVQANSPEL